MRVSVATGQIAELVSVRAIGSASGGATLIVDILDEDTNQSSVIANIAAGATRVCDLPSIGTAATASGNLPNTTGLIVAPGEYLRIRSSVALQTETLTAAFKLILYNLATIPTVDSTGSAGTPNLAASSISTANTLQRINTGPY